MPVSRPAILRVGLPDRVVTHGAPRLLHARVGFTPERIAERIEAAVSDHSSVDLRRPVTHAAFDRVPFAAR